MRFLRRILFLCVLILVVPGARVDAVSEDGASGLQQGISETLSRLEVKASRLKTLKTAFIQEKNLAAFQHPLILKGRIFMERGGRLAWHVDEPLRYSVLITDKVIRQWDEETRQIREIPLSGNPMLRTALEQISVWFNGDYSAALEEYETELVQEKPLVLRFTPKPSALTARVLKSIELTFRNNEEYLDRILILEIGGDSTLIRFENTILNSPLKEADFEVEDRA